MNYVYNVYNDETLATIKISLDVDGEVHVSCEGSIERTEGGRNFAKGNCHNIFND